MQPTPGSVHKITDAHRFELLVNALSDYAICMLDLDGFITSWNVGAQRVEGYGVHEAVGQHFSRFFTPEDQAKQLPEKILAEARATGRYEAEGWRLRKDGSRFWANAIVQPVRDEHGDLIGYAKITRDMTERMAAQEALRQANQQFRMLVEGVTDYAIYMLDPSGVVTNWNAGAERLKGYTADEVVGQHFSKFYTKEERASGIPGRVLDIAAREESYETEGWRVRKDGSRFWASVVVDAIRDTQGRLQGFAKVMRDITERRAAQEVLRESERQFRLLVRGVTDYALYMLDPNGIVTSWNLGAERMKGYVADEIIGQHFSKFYTERDRAAGMPTRALTTAMSEGRFEADGLRVRKNGDLFWANVVIDPIRDERDKLIGFAKITRDITERQKAQSALQDAQAQRAHMQKMDALGKLTGGVAHDFNNMLAVVSGYIPVIKSKVADDPKASRAAEAIALAARRGEALTRHLLTFSRRQIFDLTVVQLAERVEALRTMLASSIGASIRLITTIGAEVWPVKVDAGELELALVNITLNARDAMPSGGTISVIAENVVLSRGDTPAQIEGDFVAVRVTDTGAGIAPDVLPKIFDPFFTTKQVNKGSGLGLSQVHGFAHQSRGTVVVESELGKGTTVTLYLPRANESAHHAESEPAVERACGGNVLVVEDNPEVADVTVSMLEQLGYDVQVASDAAAALSAIDAGSFDLVVSDIVMPGGMDGVGLARVLHGCKPHLPVLLVTGYSQAAADVTGEFTVIRKPFQLADLSRMAARMIAASKQPSTTNLVRLIDVRRGTAKKEAALGEGPAPTGEPSN
jgi:PAS domain S-box-containing protein